MPDLTPVAQTKPKQLEVVTNTVNPYKPRYDTNLRKPKMDGDWFIQSTDEQFGGEW